MELPGPFWLIGCGNMAGAMLRGWLAAGMDPTQVTVIRPSGAPVADGVRVLTEPPPSESPAIAMLGFKPQQLDAVVPVLVPTIGPDTLVISLLAGITAETLVNRFPAQRNIVRAMPNTPVAVGRGGISLCCARYSFNSHHDAPPEWIVEELMHPLGHVEWIEDESLFDVVAALTASGPAFVFRFIDALAAGAADLGLPSDQAQRLALATVEGAAALAASSSESPHQLAERVASPGGMTRKGLDILDADERLNQLVHATLEAAVRRSREMGEAARRQ